MIENLKDFIERLKADFLRGITLFSLAFLLSLIEKSLAPSDDLIFLKAVISSSSLILFIVGFSHVLRRVIFPQIDLKEFARKALSEPLAASIVFLGISIVLSTLIFVNVMLIS